MSPTSCAPPTTARGGTSSRSPTSPAHDVERLLDTARALERSLDREVKKLPDAPRPARRQPVLRVVDTDALELRPRRQAPLRRHDVAARLGLVGRQGRVPQGHGADAGRVRPRRDRRPPSAHRRATARRRPPPRRTSSTPATASTSTRPRRCSTCTRCARRSTGSRGFTWRSSGTCSTRGWRARSSRRCGSSARRSTLVGPPTLVPRGIEEHGLHGLARDRRRSPTRTSSTSSACSRSACFPERPSCRRCASTRRCTASRRSGCDRGRW